MKRIAWFLAGAVLVWTGSAQAASEDALLAWPPLTKESRPWAYWWWMGSAVDTTNLTRELQRYHDAGMGGVHIIPIYGAKGWEEKYIEYLSPRWMEMLSHTVSEARRLGMDVDMTTGTGWCFGGPHVTDQEANALVVAKTFDVPEGGRLKDRFDRQRVQALVAFSPTGTNVDLTAKLGADGSVDWTASGGPWRVYAVSQKPSGQKVKRASPGGGGHMLNLIYPAAMRHYLDWFEGAFARYQGPKPRAMYHDSYEYRSDWAPDFFAQFEKRRGYRLQDELPALFGKEESERAARVKCDYRETISDIMTEESLPMWAQWSRNHGFITRNEAHGSPGNLLDLYATADVPETEMFYKDRNKLVSKFASSAAHVTGKRLVGCETGTWLQEHFTETLADMKYLLDDLFLSGVNHVFYHGTCYSPDEAPWPGWLFYASFEMNPRNPIWRDVPALNAYVSRCQSLLQSGQPDNDILLYWPIHDRWHNAKGMAQPFTVHARDWLEDQPIGKVAERLWNRGYAFDYISDRQLASTQATGNAVTTGGATYGVVVVPACAHLPLPTLQKLLNLAESGATVIFEKQLPQDVPGWAKLQERRTELRMQLDRLRLAELPGTKATAAAIGTGRVLVGELEDSLNAARIARETMTDQNGIMCLRRSMETGRHYFIANRGEQALDGWVTLAKPAQSVVAMDPITGRSGLATLRRDETGQPQVRLQLQPGESLFLRCLTNSVITASRWPTRTASGQPTKLTGTWQVTFIQGGPALPPDVRSSTPGPWTQLGGEEAQRFAGTARYALTFDAPASADGPWFLDLGQVCQSARVRLNGQEQGTLFTKPFRVFVERLKPRGNVLEVEVTSTAANRIRDLDRRKVSWKTFHDINLVNLNYKPFDASAWPLADSGLLGPVTIVPVQQK